MVALILRNAVFVQVRLFGAVPELVLLVVIAVAMHDGPEAAAVVGFVGGFLQDLTNALTPVGLSCLAFVLVGFAAGLVHSYVIRPGRLLPTAMAGAGVLAALLTAIAVGGVVGQEYLVSGYQLRVAFWASCYSALTFPGVLLVVRRVLLTARLGRLSAV